MQRSGIRVTETAQGARHTSWCCTTRSAGPLVRLW